MIKKRQQAGFSLIEVLVAILVLMVGILGVAGMQMVSFQTNQAAYARSQAIYLAQDIFDRIRANPTGYATSTVYDNVLSTSSGTIPNDPACVTTAGGCTPAQMAQQDVREWADNFVDVFSSTDYRPTLPGGVGQLTRTALTNTFTATITWNERDWNNGSRTIESRQVAITVTLN
jgi:type IV pilus assembly protein PilV